MVDPSSVDSDVFGGRAAGTREDAEVPTNEGDDGEDDSSGEEEPTPEVDGDEHQAKQQACLARLSALEGNQVTVCVLSLSPPPRHQPPA